MSRLKLLNLLTQAFITSSALAVQEKHKFFHMLFTFPYSLSVHTCDQQEREMFKHLKIGTYKYYMGHG